MVKKNTKKFLIKRLKKNRLRKESEFFQYFSQSYLTFQEKEDLLENARK